MSSRPPKKVEVGTQKDNRRTTSDKRESSSTSNSEIPGLQPTDSGSPTEKKASSTTPAIRVNRAPSHALTRWLAQEPHEDSWTVYSSHIVTLNQGTTTAANSTASMATGSGKTTTSSGSSSKGFHSQDRSQ